MARLHIRKHKLLKFINKIEITKNELVQQTYFETSSIANIRNLITYLKTYNKQDKVVKLLKTCIDLRYIFYDTNSMNQILNLCHEIISDYMLNDNDKTTVYKLRAYLTKQPQFKKMQFNK